MIVVDASAAVLALLDDGDARSRLGQDALAAPHLADAEVMSSLRRLVAAGSLEVVVAEQAIRTWASLGIERLAITGVLDRVWELRANLTAYDAAYVALAETLDCTLLTADARLATAPGPRCPVTIVRS